MLEVACAVCGAVYRFSPTDVPAGGKTVTCARCKARIVVQAPPPPPPMDGGTGDVIDLGGGGPPRDIVDLPAPRPASAGPRVPSPAATDLVDLPAPRVAAAAPPAEVVDLPAPRVAPPAPPAEVVDLPAPRLIPKGQADALTLDNIDLLAPVGPTRSRPPDTSPVLVDPPARRPAPEAPAAAMPAIPDLPAPKRAASPARPSFDSQPPPFASPQSYPTPRAGTSPGLGHSAAPAAPGDLPDLPTPKHGGPGRDLFDDLPARGPSLADLPTPKRPSTRTAPPPMVTRPPASPSNPALAVPPVAHAPGSTDLPAPKGFFDDLPRPAPTRETPDLPAPKGFFDDLPQPAPGGGVARPDLPAPKGFFDDLPQPAGPGKPDLPAPKGFFDDLPQPAGPGKPDLPAPKGFFDDLPQAADPHRPGVPVPKGFFDDLPQPGYAASGVDLPIPRELQQPQQPPMAQDDPAARRPRTADYTSLVTGDAPPLDLGDDQLSGLDLPPGVVPATRTGVVSFRAGGGDEFDAPGRPQGGSLGELDLAKQPKREAGTTSKEAPRAEAAAAPRRNLRKVALIAGLALTFAGAGGYLLYDRWQTKKARAEAIESDLSTAQRALIAGQWGRAGTAARAVLERAPTHGDALATAALAQLAGYQDQGTNREARVKAGQGFLEKARLASARGATMTKAMALDTLIAGDAEEAITRLAPLAPGDKDALLYLGWAQLAAGRWDDAAATFEQAATATPARKLLATYGRAQALLGKGERDAAREQFLAVIAADAEHVGAQVGVAASSPPSAFLEREKELLAILQRPKLEDADPRVVALAWRLAGDDARSAGRLDAARDRYRKAIELQPDDVGTIVAAAALELRDGKLEEAGTGVERALALAADDIDANLVKIELDLRRGETEGAATRLQALRDRQPPVTAAAHLGKLELLDGDRLAATGDADGALAAYQKASDILGDGDIAPTIAIATLLGRMATAADGAGKRDEAAALRKRATDELAELSGKAATDPAVAVALGVAYLDAGGLAEAERWLRSAIAARPTDVEPHFQLSEVLRRAGRTDEAIGELKQAYGLAPQRVYLGLSLARAYETAGKDADARAAYEQLLAGEDDPDKAAAISLDVRARAGRFFARTGDGERAGALAEAILAAEPDNATGRFLKGEALLAAGKHDEARRELQRAADRDPDPQFLDGLGRGWEALYTAKNDTAARDEALRAYRKTTEGRAILGAAADVKPVLLHAAAAAGRLHLHRGEYEEAIVRLTAVYREAPSAEVAANIGTAYQALGNSREAIRYLELAARGDAPPRALYLLGKLYRDSNRPREAAAALARATDRGADEEKVPNTTVWLTDAFYVLGDLQEQNGRLAEACRAYKGWLGRSPTDEAMVKAVQQRLIGLPGCR